MESYRILYLSSQFPSHINPHIGVFSVERVRALSRSGCQVTVIAPVLMTPPPDLVLKPFKLASWFMKQVQLPNYSRIEGVEVHQPKWIGPPKSIFGWTINAFEWVQIRRTSLLAAAKLKPQLILSSWLPDGVAACQLGKYLDLPVLCIADGSDVNMWPKTYPYWHYARDILNRHASAIIYVSDALRLAGKAIGLHPPIEMVIHNAVDVKAYEPSTNTRNDDTFSILVVGRMLPLKGHSILMEAFAEFSNRLGRESRLTFVGDGVLRHDLEQQAAQLGILPLVQFAGSVAPQQVIDYYQAADLLCLPSYSEGLPCVVIEAMACGKPVVASRVGGVPEVLDEQSGIMVPPGDPHALCEELLHAALRIWDTEGIRRRIVEHFSWTQWTEKLFQLIRLVIEVQSVDEKMEA